MKKRILTLLLVLCMVLPLLTVPAAAGQLEGCNVMLTVDGRGAVLVKGYHMSYDHNLLLSGRDLAMALKGTPKAFSLELWVDEEDVRWILLERGGSYTAVGGEHAPVEVREVTKELYGDLAYWKMKLDGEEIKLPVYFHNENKNLPGDVFFRLVDLQMYLELDLRYAGENMLTLETRSQPVYDLQQQDSDGYFHFLHSILLGDADTGRILFSHDADEVTQIASTTKLMTYLLAKEAMDAGAFTEYTLYSVSEAVFEEANSEDGIYRQKGAAGSLDLGALVTGEDLLNAMLLRSANEAALALAEMVSGSEKDFVELMNIRARELGLTTAVFYNPHGLPDYTREETTSKRQNEMSAADMFRLTAYLLEHHGDHLTAITSQKIAQLPSFGPCKDGKTAYAKTTNALLYNLPECIGLKTGTTNRSGANLVSVVPVTDVEGTTHNLVVVIFGAEDDFERNEKSAWLFRCAMARYENEPFPGPQAPEPEAAQTPETSPTTALVPIPAQTESPRNPAMGRIALVLIALCLLLAVLTVLVILLLIRSDRKHRGRYGK